MVVQSIAFLKCHISSPVADFDIALETRDQSQWPGKLVAHTNSLRCTGWNLAEEPVLQLRTGLGWEIGAAGALGARDLCILEYVAGRKLDVCFLLEGRVG